MTDFSKTLIRCHALGSIMSPAKGKTPQELYESAVDSLELNEQKYQAFKNKECKSAIETLDKVNKLKVEIPILEANKDEIVLSETCKSYLIQSYVLSKYNRVREIQTKQMIKGVVSEEESIALFSLIDGNKYTKNTDRLSNDYISGTPDLHSGDELLFCDEIIDVKTSWDIFTFLSNVPDPNNFNYYCQLQGYMALTGAKIGTIAYCLVNTPDSIIEGEKYNLLRRLDVATEEAPEYKKEMAKLIHNRKFDDIPAHERVLTFSIERNDDFIEKIYATIEKCREFLGVFEQEHLSFSKNNRKKISI
jgi:hypothetical protein